jgi:hypothetical protein
MIMSGKATGCGAFTSGIYRNDFPFFVKLGNSFSTLFRSTVQWADYDNDGDLDFIITGLTTSESPVTKIYRNTEGLNLFQQNSIPEAPATIEAEVDGNSVIFNWARGSDNETPTGGLYYNFRLGTTMGGCEIISCMAHLENGSRKIIGIGNTNQDTAWIIKDLDPGTYYYSVQTIDQCYAGSEFSPAQSFTITATSVNEMAAQTSVDVYPNPAEDHINISFDKSAWLTVTDLKGGVIISGEISGNDRIDVSDLGTGIYFIRIDEGNETRSGRFIKK